MVANAIAAQRQQDWGWLERRVARWCVTGPIVLGLCPCVGHGSFVHWCSMTPESALRVWVGGQRGEVVALWKVVEEPRLFPRCFGQKRKI